MKNFVFIIIVFFITVSCNRQKDIDLHLPPYENKLFVECYLEPGLPLGLALTLSVSYFDPPQVPSVNDALVTITHGGKTDTLKYAPISIYKINKRYNYVLLDTIPADYNSDFILSIRARGKTVTGITKILPPVKIDSTRLVYNKDSAAYLNTYFKDNPNTQDYYRYVIDELTIGNDTTIERRLDILFVDQITDGQALNKIRAYNFKKIPTAKKTLIVSLYHIDKSYYDYQQSILDATDSNGNPFAQPTSILSTVSGGLGVFTGLSSDRKAVDLK